MARQRPDELEKELREEEEEFYGDDFGQGGEPVEDTEETLEEAVGNEVDNTKPFSIAEEVEKDEKGHRYPEPESDLEKIEKKEDDNSGDDDGGELEE